MSGRVLPAELRRAAEAAARGVCPDPLLLREAADELVGLREAVAGLQGVITRLRQRGDDLVELLSEARGYVEGYGPTLLDDIDRVLDEAARTAGGADDGLPGRFIGHDADGGEVFETPSGFRYNAGPADNNNNEDDGGGL